MTADRFRSLHRMLHALGWPESALERPDAWPSGPAARSFFPECTRGVRPLYITQSGIRELIILVLEESKLPPAGTTLGSFRDFSPSLGDLLDVAGAFSAPGEHVLLADDARFYLYDLDRREALLTGENRSDWEDVLYPLLSHTRGLRETLARLPRRGAQQQGRHLAHFLDTVRHEVGAHSRRSREEVERLVLQLLVSAFYSLREPREAGSPPVRLFWERLSSPDRSQPVSDVICAIAASFERLYRRHSLPLFETPQGTDGFLDQWQAFRPSEEERAFRDLLEGFLCQCPAKYSSDVMEHALLDDEDVRKTWQQAIREPLALDRHLQYEGATIYEPLEVDVERNGIGWGLQTLRACLDLFEFERQDQLTQVTRYGTTGQTEDLFKQPSAGADNFGVVQDPVMLVLNDAIRWRGLEQGTSRDVAMALIAVAVWEWLWDLEHPDRQRLHASFAALPRMLGQAG